MKTLQFPPICSTWCSTYAHLKRLHLENIELARICHKCITWEVPRPSKPKPAATQPKLPIDE